MTEEFANKIIDLYRLLNFHKTEVIRVEAEISKLIDVMEADFKVRNNQTMNNLQKEKQRLEDRIKELTEKKNDTKT